MALTESTMIPLGSKAPDFTLPCPRTEKNVSLNDIRGDKGLLVMFICNHCPFVKHVEQALVQLGNDYQDKAIGIVAISSNDAENYPEDSPEMMAQKSYPFPYLYDESQDIAKSYGAACTPDFFLFNSDLNCVYRGQFDDSRPGNDAPINGASLRTAMDALLTGQPIDPIQKNSVGCNIKWRK